MLKPATPKLLFSLLLLYQLVAQSAVNTLDIIDNCLTADLIEKFNQLNIKVIADKQKTPYRYYSATE
ncbi:hypothetical protein A6769_39515 [Nostoc punctiforme NIES-2108]|uniref:Uncharacterized protein n=1 Tax=Nostoc punctiforme NIES-2108 TaxID=1356359 RepID=A0A367RYJ6_NOSPU|nr:hypothetical protein A6769_39515 [Nostoc punctiforme NIES-2108]